MLRNILDAAALVLIILLAILAYQSGNTSAMLGWIVTVIYLIRCKLKEFEVELTSENGNNTKPLVSGSLLSDEQIRRAADEWVFDENDMKWSINDDTAGDNYGSFIAGAKWVLSRLSNDR